MDLEFNADQRAVLDAAGRIADTHASASILGAAVFERSAALEADLEAAGLYDTATTEGLGPVAAAALVMRLARLPQTLALTASALLLPLQAPDWPRPGAVLWAQRDRPARWLPAARTVLCVRGDVVEAAALHDGDVLTLPSPFGHPVGRLHQPDTLPWQVLAADAQACRVWWQVGLAAELAGHLGAALDAVVEHVTHRRQFGRPLGAFQAVQHRLAEAAVRVEALRWLVLQAAHSGLAADAAAAAGHAQQSAQALVYDLHQFMGAMGLTLEHPLHRWTSRARMLQADLGGAEARYQDLADARWGHTDRVPA